MSPNVLAARILGYTGTTSLIAPGALIADLGADAVQDAISRGWLRPDLDTGNYLTVTNQQSQINEMRELASKPENKAQVQQESVSRSFVLSHSGRNLAEAFGVGMTSGASVSAPGSGQTRMPGTMQPPEQPGMGTPGQDYTVGEDVVIADEGKSYQAKISTKNPDGTYKLTFGPNRPLNQERAFRREEMQRIQPEREGTVKVQQ